MAGAAAAADGRWPALLLMGPTAMGKTDLAVALAQRLPVRLISVDSAMVYRDMDIGTAKPPAALLQRYPHDLIDIRDPATAYCAAEFVDDALAAMRAARSAGQLPVLVGGTMMYFRSLLAGMAELPRADAGVRAAIDARAAELGWPALHAELARVDASAAAGIDPHNAQRVQRALEVHQLTGKPISWWWAREPAAPAEDEFQLHSLALLPSRRAELHERIEQRFDAMLAAGLLEEVAALRRRAGVHADLPSMRAVGYRQAWSHLDGELDAEALRYRGIVATRQLAKRQLTWLRRWPGLREVAVDLPSPAAPARALEVVLQYTRAVPIIS